MVSPHLDDSIISCGLTILALRSAGWSVVAATVFSDAPSAQVPALARHFNTMDGGDAVDGLRRRRAEDERALTRLGADPLHLGFFDASMRRDAHGGWLCTSYSDVRDLDPLSDRGLLEQIGVSLEETVASVGATLVLIPAGVGGHVDHRLTRAAFEASGAASVETRRYEDLPYAFEGHADVNAAALCSGEASHMEAKLDALALYASQVGFLPGASRPGGWSKPFRRHAYVPATDRFVERAVYSESPPP